MTESELHTTVAIIKEDLERLKADYKERIIEIEKNLHANTISVNRMEITDKNIFDKLEDMFKIMEKHRSTFHEHDKKEMEKYGDIDRRLVKLEKVMFMGTGIIILLQILNQFHLLNVG